ncbi:CotY/CotZ family spore coat protein [Heyndrickxia ginsengihumi]|uniref:CotY/CotZ family spore coat protein n=1 Tax=Heyndrickxia ginsengihumi TaxID=363870 RepID=UPI003D21919D
MSLQKHDIHCVCDIVHFINDLQDAIEDDNNCPTHCLNPVLGGTSSKRPPKNTRPFVLFTEDGKPFEAFFKPIHDGWYCPCDEDVDGNDKKAIDFFCKSKFFRVESVEGCCAVLRVLEPACINSACPQVDNPQENLMTSHSCITVDLNKFSAIQCLDDIYLEGV